MFDEVIKTLSEEIPVRISSPSEGDCAMSMPMHYHNAVEILCVSKGTFVCVIGGKEYTLNKDDIVFINSRVPHSTYRDAGVSYGMVQISIDQFFSKKTSQAFISTLLLSDENQFEIFEAEEERTHELWNMLYKVFNQYESKEKGTSLFLLGKLYSIVGFLIREQIILDPDEFFYSDRLNKLAPAINHIANNYKWDISLADLAATTNMSKSHFCRLFKSVTGKTCVEFINSIRIYQAEKLINSTNKSLIEISMEIGFSSQAYFNRTFKKLKGYSPSYYRKLKFGEVDKKLQDTHRKG